MDYRAGDDVDFEFNTVDGNFYPATLGGTPVIKIYKDNSDTTEVTTGVTLTVDFDSQTGRNHVRVATSDGFYANGHDYFAVITTGTIGGSSVAGRVVGRFSLKNRSVRDIETDTQDIQARLPAALTGAGYMQADVLKIEGADPSDTIRDSVLSDATRFAGADIATILTAIAAYLDAAVSSRLAAVSYTAPPSANQNADALLDRANAIETGITPRGALRLTVAAAAGETSGMETATPSIKNPAGTKTRITGTDDADGNRSGITVDTT